MKILVLGATGYIGAAAVARLTQDGHEIVRLVRDASRVASELPHRVGDLSDPESLSAAVTDDIDAVVHIASPIGDQAADTAAVDALLAPLRGTGRAFVYTSGVWVLGATDDAPVDEEAATNPIPLVGYRPLIEQRVLAAAADGVRATVLRPGIVYGDGGGIPAMMVGWAREHGTGRYVGAADTRWPMVHVADLADLYALALGKDAPGGVLHAVALAEVPVAGLAAVADVAAGGTGRAEPWPGEAAAAAFGALFAEALGLNQVVSARRTVTELGWQPSRPHPFTALLSDVRGS
ncbi:NAD-dependent epimerase/dehydratase family protein [Kitasatospora acidiphila]|uniref:NAD-dependent epimerase/dehydratase family protein n=1 Tax=Kitasatospora acidiphila TaxID=2567942 RepID=A0A540VYR8_9ACTN|nr:NAD-dependent epimerase/dehydratase family protein [Kitasatospora acidiphila]TQF01867.1 NAD-dependent epimerase/dehydratase family protein [Kitasatospora acidiphila]